MAKAKTLEDIVEILGRPTPPQEVSYIPRGVKAKQGSSSEGFATAIPYVDSTYVENTLDEAAGKFGWQSDIKEVAGRMCEGIGIKDPETKEWVWRWDVGIEVEQDKHGSKSEVTGGIKRSARQWGVARDLKDYPKPRLRCKIWVGNDKKARFIEWLQDPKTAVLQKQNGQGPPGPEGPSGEPPPPPQESGAEEGHQPDDVTPNQARRMVYDFAVQHCEYTEQGAIKWISDHEQEHGKGVESYRIMYGLLQDIKKQNEPPREEEEA